MANFISREEAQRITERALSFSEADEARVNLSSSDTGNTRFAQNQMSTSGDATNATLSISSALGTKVASATTNIFTDDALRRVVETSEALARLVPENEEYMGELSQQTYPDSSPYFESTGELAPERRAQAITAVTEQAAARDLISTGFLIHQAASTAVATSNGLFAYGTNTRVNFTTTVRTPDGTGSGWAGTSAHDFDDLDTRALGAVAVEKAMRSRQPRAVEPGRWTVVMEPTTVGNMVNLMMNQTSARNADEGRSFFSKAGGGTKLGEQFVDSRVNIHSDPMDSRILSTPFDGQGLPNKPMSWIEDGKLQNLNYSRYWADRQGVQPTGFPSGWYMAGGNSSVDEMIRSTERGLLLTRFWYIRGVDPRTILYTGLTRDGTFLIENGEISHPVKNFRWNESPIFMLNNIEMMGEPIRISSGESSGLTNSVVVPPLKVRDFTFTSLSDAI
jgi:predicted Zn-dependent protease